MPVTLFLSLINKKFTGIGNFFEMLLMPVTFLRSRYNQGFSDGRDSQSRLNYDRDQSKYDQGFIDGMKAKVRDAMNL